MRTATSGLSWGLLGLLLVSCTRQPSRIEVKGPADSLAAAHGITELPVFEEKNESLRLRVSALDEQGRYMGTAKASWRSLDPTVATVDQQGVVTVLSSGTTEIVATTTETQPPLEGRITVRAVIVGGVEITDPPKSAPVPVLPMGELVRFVAVVKDDRGEVIPDAEVRWESTTWAATVAVDGEVEGRSIGKTTIVASAKNGASDRRELEVGDWPRKKR